MIDCRRSRPILLIVRYRRQLVLRSKSDNQVALTDHQCVRQHYQTGVRLTRQHFDLVLDIGRISHGRSGDLDSQTHAGAFDLAHEAIERGIVHGLQHGKPINRGAVSCSTSSHLPPMAYS